MMRRKLHDLYSSTDIIRLILKIDSEMGELNCGAITMIN